MRIADSSIDAPRRPAPALARGRLKEAALAPRAARAPSERMVDQLGTALRRSYAGVLAEPLPENLRALAGSLERAARR